MGCRLGTMNARLVLLACLHGSLACASAETMPGASMVQTRPPYSHSVTSAILLAVVVAAALRTALPRRDLALAAGLAIFSHVVLDVAQHQPDILLLPASVGPRLGTGLLDRPLLNLAVELAYGVACWWIYRYLDVRSASGKAAGGSVTGLNGSCSETQGVHGTTLAIVDRNGEPAGLLHGLSIRRSF